MLTSMKRVLGFVMALMLLLVVTGTASADTIVGAMHLLNCTGTLDEPGVDVKIVRPKVFGAGRTTEGVTDHDGKFYFTLNNTWLEEPIEFWYRGNFGWRCQPCHVGSGRSDHVLVLSSGGDDILGICWSDVLQPGNVVTIHAGDIGIG